jgi:hypothetical protein
MGMYADETDECVMCGANVEMDEGMVKTCSRHFVHSHCYVYWRKMMDGSQTAECPSAHFQHSEGECENLKYRI